MALPFCCAGWGLAIHCSTLCQQNNRPSAPAHGRELISANNMNTRLARRSFTDQTKQAHPIQTHQRLQTCQSQPTRHPNHKGQGTTLGIWASVSCRNHPTTPQVRPFRADVGHLCLPACLASTIVTEFKHCRSSTLSRPAQCSDTQSARPHPALQLCLPACLQTLAKPWQQSHNILA
jgi:hypothetical protein